MKRILTMAITLMALVCAVTGCAISGELQVVKQPGSIEVSAQAPADKIVSAPATAAAAFGSSDMAVVVEGASYPVRENAGAVLTALGGGYECTETISCVYEGMDKFYDYGGIAVSTVPDGEEDIVEMFTLTDAGYSTTRGVKVGDARDDVISAYGEDYFDDGYLTYSTTNDPDDIQAERIQFYMEDDTVAEIYIYSPSY